MGSSEKADSSFNTQPPEGGWFDTAKIAKSETVSTHSRLKAAGFFPKGIYYLKHGVSTHSRLKAAGNQHF